MRKNHKLVCSEEELRIVEAALGMLQGAMIATPATPTARWSRLVKDMGKLIERIRRECGDKPLSDDDRVSRPVDVIAGMMGAFDEKAPKA